METDKTKCKLCGVDTEVRYPIETELQFCCEKCSRELEDCSSEILFEGADDALDS